MKRYRLNPAKPRQLTTAEARRLDTLSIDYSDLPPLGDEFLKKAKAVWPPAKTASHYPSIGESKNKQPRMRHLISTA